MPQTDQMEHLSKALSSSCGENLPHSLYPTNIYDSYDQLQLLCANLGISHNYFLNITEIIFPRKDVLESVLVNPRHSESNQIDLHCPSIRFSTLPGEPNILLLESTYCFAVYHYISNPLFSQTDSFQSFQKQSGTTTTTENTNISESSLTCTTSKSSDLIFPFSFCSIYGNLSSLAVFETELVASTVRDSITENFTRKAKLLATSPDLYDSDLGAHQRKIILNEFGEESTSNFHALFLPHEDDIRFPDHSTGPASLTMNSMNLDLKLVVPKSDPVQSSQIQSPSTPITTNTSFAPFLTSKHHPSFSQSPFHPFHSTTNLKNTTNQTNATNATTNMSMTVSTTAPVKMYEGRQAQIVSSALHWTETSSPSVHDTDFSKNNIYNSSYPSKFKAISQIDTEHGCQVHQTQLRSKDIYVYITMRVPAVETISTQIV